jgi:RNA polymerase sigma-70 factor (ECF subfamily)
MAAATLAFGRYETRSGGESFHSPVGVPAGRNLIESTLDPDSSLVSRCLRGDETAWEDLVRLHTRKVYALCYRFTGSGSEAQDLTQEVFLRVFRTVKTFRSTEGSFATWLSRVTRNLLIDHYRRTRQDRVTDSIEEQLPTMEEFGV